MANKTWILLDNLTKIQSQPISLDDLKLAIARLPKHEYIRYFIWTTGWQNWQPLNEYLESDQKTLSVTLQSVTDLKNPTPLNQNDNTLTQTKLDFTSSQNEKTVHHENTYSAQSSLTYATTSDYQKPDKNLINKNDYNGDLIEAKAPTVNHLNFKSINDPYHARSERHEFKIEILLINKKNKTFRSFSKNISLSGTLLEEVVPIDFYDDNFDLVVVNRNPTNTLNARVQLRAEVIKNEGLTQRITFISMTPIQKQRLKDLLNDYINQQKKKKSA